MPWFCAIVKLCGRLRGSGTGPSIGCAFAAGCAAAGFGQFVAGGLGQLVPACRSSGANWLTPLPVPDAMFAGALAGCRFAVWNEPAAAGAVLPFGAAVLPVTPSLVVPLASTRGCRALLPASSATGAAAAWSGPAGAAAIGRNVGSFGGPT